MKPGNACGTDTDGDGLGLPDDRFPDDPERAYRNHHPQRGYYTLAYDYGYPRTRDADFNDAVFLYRFDYVHRADGRLKSMSAIFNLVARSTQEDAAFHFRLGGLEPGSRVRVTREGYASDGAHETGRAKLLIVDAGGRIRIPVWTSLADAMPAAGNEEGVNTHAVCLGVAAASARLVIVFENPVDPHRLPLPPYDPMLLFGDEHRRDLHLVGGSGLAERSPELPHEQGPLSFRDAEHLPWALAIPAIWSYPLEGIPIGDRHGATGAYGRFSTWRQSLRVQARDWYLHPNEGRVVPAAVLRLVVPSGRFEQGHSPQRLVRSQRRGRLHGLQPDSSDARRPPSGRFCPSTSHFQACAPRIRDSNAGDDDAFYDNRRRAPRGANLARIL